MKHDWDMSAIALCCTYSGVIMELQICHASIESTVVLVPILDQRHVSKIGAACAPLSTLPADV